jgi:hypothetical protein
LASFVVPMAGMQLFFTDKAWTTSSREGCVMPHLSDSSLESSCNPGLLKKTSRKSSAFSKCHHERLGDDFSIPFCSFEKFCQGGKVATE